MKTAILVVGLCLALSGMTRAQDADCRFAPGSRKGHVRLDRHSPEPGFDPVEVVRRVQAQREPEPRHKRTRRPSAEGPELWTDAGEFLIDTSIVYAPAPDDQWFPAVAFDGANFLVVWTDLRGGWDYDIYGARVSPGGVVLEPAGIAISTAADGQWSPAVAFDGANFLVVWTDRRSGWDYDIYGARVSPGGTVYDEGPVVRQEKSQVYPALARGSGSQMFLVYQGWAGTVGGKTYNTQRIWGKMDPSVGVEERSEEPRGKRQEAIATIVRGVLNLGAGHNPILPGESGLCPKPALLDISGRKVMELQPGENDIRHLSPGVYFVRTALWERSPDPPAAARAGRDFVRKVVIQR